MQSIELIRIHRKLGCLVFSLILSAVALPAQYLIEGQLDSNFNNTIAHLDQLDKWNGFGSVSDQMTIKSSKIDSVGRFRFEGSELSDRDGIYRVRYAPIEQKVIISWNPKNYINFIFSDNDSIQIRNTEIISNNSRNEKLAVHMRQFDAYRLEFYSTQNELHQDLLKTKYQDYCREEILKTDDGLVNMYCLARSEISILSDIGIYKKVHRELGASAVKPNYQSSLGILINTHEFDSVKSRSQWLLYLLLTSLGLNAFLAWRFIKNRELKMDFPNLGSLTSKEKEVLDLIISNKSNKDISMELFVSDATVKTHINNIYRKLNVNSRKQAIDLYKSQKSTPV